MADRYWLKDHDGAVSGPFSGAALKKMARKKKLDLSCQVSTDQVRWTTAAKIRNLFADVETALATDVGVGSQVRGLTRQEFVKRLIDEFVLKNDNFKDTFWFVRLVPQLRVWWLQLTPPARGFVIKEVTAEGVRNVKYDLGAGEAKEISEGEAERNFSDGVRQARLFNSAYRALLVVLGVGWVVWLFYDFVTHFSLTFGTMKTILFAAAAVAGFIYKARRTKVFVGYHMDQTAQFRLRQIAEAVSVLKGCGRVWMYRRQRHEGDQGWKYNAGESFKVHRLPVAFFGRSIPNVQTNIRVNGIAFSDTAVYFLPEKALVIRGGEVTNVPYDSLHVRAESLEFPDAEGPPYSDTPVVGNRWKYINRDGSQDRRFKDNVEIPVIRCGILKLAVGQARLLDLMTTNPNAPAAFGERLSRLARLPGVAPSKGRTLPSVAVEPTPAAVDVPEFDAPEPSRTTVRPVRLAGPRRPPLQIPRVVWLLGGVAGLFLVCCCGPLTIGWYGSHAAASALAEADKEYGKGDREEAVAKYVANYEFSPEKEKILKRIVEYKAENGDGAGATRWIGTGLDSGFNIAYDGPAAQNLLAQVQKDRADKEAQKKADDAAAEAKRKSDEVERVAQREAEKVRAKADAEARAKVDMADEEINQIIRQLDSQDIDTQIAAVRQLGRHRGRKVVGALVHTITGYNDRDDFDHQVGNAGMEAMLRMGPEIVDDLIDIAANSKPNATIQETRERFNALTTIENMMPPPKNAIPGLRKLVDDPLVGRTASQLLKKIKG